MPDIPNQLLAAFPPSFELLLERIRARIDDSMLMHIALADYGMNADEAFEHLCPIRDTGVLPDVLPWHLSEVLRLTSFSQPDGPNQQPLEPDSTRIRAHLIRLFVCAVLMRDDITCGHLFADDMDDSMLARCLLSVNILGRELNEALGCFLTWHLARKRMCSRRELPAFAVLLIAARLRHGKFTETELGEFADWVIAEDSYACSSEGGFCRPSGSWLPLTDELSGIAGVITQEDVSAKLNLCTLVCNS